MSKPVAHNFYRAHKRVQKTFTKPSLTVQSEAHDLDINNIMKKYGEDALRAHALQFQGKYGDFTHAVDFHTMQNMVLEAHDMFMTLPADMRAEFENDAQQFVDFVSKATDAELGERGLIPPGSPQVETPAAPSGEPAQPTVEPVTDPAA